ncbi:MAG: hypothetical protein ACRC68_17610 [Clostridium sp.]
MYDYNEELIKVRRKLHWFDIFKVIFMYVGGYLILFNIKDDELSIENRLIGAVLIFIIPIAIIFLEKAIGSSDSSIVKYLKKNEIDKLKNEGKYFGAVFEDELIRFTGFVSIERRNGTDYRAESFSEVLVYYSEIVEIYVKKEHVKIYYSKGKVVYNFNVSYYFNNSIDLAKELKSRTDAQGYEICSNL